MGESIAAPRKRGRPKKIKYELSTEDSVLWKVANEIEKECGIPGCSPRLHLESATKIISIVKDGN